MIHPFTYHKKQHGHFANKLYSHYLFSTITIVALYLWSVFVKKRQQTKVLTLSTAFFIHDK